MNRSYQRRCTKGPRARAALLACALAAGLPIAIASPAGAHPPLSEAEAAVDHSLEKDPDNATLHLERAYIDRKKADWDRAAASFVRAATLGADPHTVDLALADVFLRAGLAHTGQAYVERVLGEHPDHARALIAHARIRVALDDKQTAADDLRRAVTLLPDPEPALITEAMNAQLDVAERDRALAVADTAMQKIGVIATIQLPAIELERELGRFDRALARTDTLLVQAPRHEGWLALRGDILVEAGRADEARATYEKALSLIRKRPPDRRGEKITMIERHLRVKLDDDKPVEEKMP